MLATLALCSFCTPALAAAPVQSPDLYVLARLNRIMRVSGYDGPSPLLETLVTYTTEYLGFPRGMEIDRATGNFYVLLSDYNTNTFADSSLLTVDGQTGDTLSVLSLPGVDIDGLEQRADGEFFAIRGGEHLLRIDVLTGATTSIPIVPPLPTSILGLTIDETGVLVAQTFGPFPSHRYTIDPADGSSTAAPTAFGSLALESDGNGRLFHAGFTAAVGIRIEDLATGTTTEIPGTGQETSNVYAMCFRQGVDGEGVHPVCDGLVNSTGKPATLETIGTSVLAQNELTLYSRQLPTSSFGYFLTGPNLSFQAVGSGILCIGTPVARYSNSPLFSGPEGVVRFDIDFFNMPAGTTPIVGQTDIFQYWYRDVGGTSNLSTAQAVTLR